VGFSDVSKLLPVPDQSVQGLVAVLCSGSPSAADFFAWTVLVRAVEKCCDAPAFFTGRDYPQDFIPDVGIQRATLDHSATSETPAGIAVIRTNPA
jgi:hypothetical protein